MSHGQNADLAVFKYGSQHHYAAGLVPELVPHGTQGVHVGYAYLLHQRVDALHIFHLVRRVGGFRCRHLAFQGFHLLAGIFGFRQQHVQPFFHVGSAAVEFSRHVADGLFQPFHISHCAIAGHRFDTAHPGAGGRLADDLEQTDLCRVGHMHAAAQFHREFRNGDHTDYSAVFLTEQGHGAPLLRFFNRYFLKGNCFSSQDLLIHHFLNLSQLFRGHRREMGEVEMETVRAYITAGLVYMAAQYTAQGCLQQMGRRMIPGNVRLADGINFKGNFIAFCDGPLFHRTRHVCDAVRQLLRLGNPHHARRGFDDADVTQLSAAFCMERRHVQDHRRVLSVGNGLYRLGVGYRINLHYFACMGGFIYFQLSRVQVTVIVQYRASGLVVPGIPCHLALHFQGSGKALFVQGHAVLFQNFRSQLFGEAEGIGELEGNVTVQLCFARFLQFCNFHIQHVAAAL